MERDDIIERFTEFNTRADIVTGPFKIVWAMQGHHLRMPARSNYIYEPETTYLWLGHYFNPKRVIHVVIPKTDWLLKHQPELIVGSHHRQCLIELAS